MALGQPTEEEFYAAMQGQLPLAPQGVSFPPQDWLGPEPEPQPSLPFAIGQPQPEPAPANPEPPLFEEPVASIAPGARTDTVSGLDNEAARLAQVGTQAQEQGIAAQSSAKAAQETVKGVGAQQQADINDEVATRIRPLIEKEAMARDADSKRTQELLAKVTPINNGWSNRSGFQKASGYLAAAIGGFLSPYHGGENKALQMIMDDIDRDIATQKANSDLALKQVGEVRAGAADRRAGVAAQMQDIDMERAVRLQGAIKKLDADLASYSSKEQIANGQVLRGQLAGQLSDTLSARSDKLNQRANDRISQGQAATRISLDKQRLGEDQRQFDETMLFNKDRLSADQQAAQAAASGKAATEDQKLRFEQEVPGTVGADGKPVVARSPQEAQKIRPQKASLDQFSNLVDEITAINKKKGGELNTYLNSPEYAAVKSKFANAQIEWKNGAELGALAKEDLKLAESALGTNDPTSFRNYASGLAAARKAAVDKFNSTLHGHDDKAKRYEPTKAQVLVDLERDKSELVKDFDTQLPPDADYSYASQYVDRLGTALDRKDFTPKEINELGLKAFGAIKNSKLSDSDKQRAAAEIGLKLLNASTATDSEKEIDALKAKNSARFKELDRGRR